MDKDYKKICRFRMWLAEIGIEVLPNDIIEAEKRLKKQKNYHPTIEEYLTELIGFDRFISWLIWMNRRHQ